MSIKIGIDLGTTNTLVGIEQKGKIKYLKFSGSDSLKSVLFYKNGEVEIGKKAGKRGIIYPKNRIKSSKTYMGDFTKEWKIEDRVFTPTDVAYEILKEVKNKVIDKLKLEENEVIEAVITVPAYFTSNQIDETKKAGLKAGLKIIRIITEPVAAAIAYGMEMGENEKLFIMDLGGGTFDITILEAKVSEGEYNTLAIGGNKKLGGDDFDEVIFKMFLKKIKEDIGLDLENYVNDGSIDEHDFGVIKANLLEEAETLKIELSETQKRTVNIPNLFSYRNQDYNFQLDVTREDLKNISAKLLENIEAEILKCLRETNIKPSEIDRVVLVGGSCNLPFINELVKDIFMKEPYSNLDLGTLVVTGATIVALNSDSLQTKIKINDTISHSLGIEVLNNGNKEFSPILKKGDIYPIEGERIYTTVSDNQRVIDINVYEGEDIYSIEKNEFYGSFALDNIEIAKAGIPQIKVRFNFDESRVLEVTAEDLKTGSKKTVVINKGEIIKSKESKLMDFSLLIDTSGSMFGNPIREAKMASISLINEILDFTIHRLSIIGFGSQITLLKGLSSDKKQLINKIEELKASGGTNMSEAIYSGITVLNEKNNREKVIILLTDGDPDNKKEAFIVANQAKNNGIKLIAIGAGSGVNSSYLKTLATREEDYYYINDISKLKETFRDIVSSLKHIS